MNANTLAADYPDAELIARSLEGEAVAFRTLYRRHEKRVRSTLRNMCGDDALDDHTQEVFIRVWKHLKGFRNESSFSTWLFRIAYNVAMDCRKAHATQRAGLLEITKAQISEEALPVNPDHRELVKKMLEAMNFEHRHILALVDLEEFSLQEAADIAGIPLGTAKSRLHYARSEARVYLEKQGWKP